MPKKKRKVNKDSWVTPKKKSKCKQHAKVDKDGKSGSSSKQVLHTNIEEKESEGNENSQQGDTLLARKKDFRSASFENDSGKHERMQAKLDDAIMINANGKSNAEETEWPNSCLNSESTPVEGIVVDMPIENQEMQLADDDNESRKTDDKKDKVNSVSVERSQQAINGKTVTCQKAYDKNPNFDISTTLDHPLRCCDEKGMLESHYVSSIKDFSTKVHHKAETGQDTFQDTHTDSNLTKNIRKGEIPNCIIVKFHAVVSAKVRLLMIESKADLYIVFGSPVSDWKSYLVQLEICTDSQFANTREMGYVTGELELSKDNIRKTILYKYVLFQGKNNYEYLVTDFNFIPLNRTLIVRTDLEYFNKYDEGLKFDLEAETISIEDIILVYTSAVNTKIAQGEILSNALRIIESIFNTFKEDRNYSSIYTGNKMTKLSHIRNIDELKHTIFSQFSNVSMQYLKMPELPNNALKLVAFMLIYVDTYNITIDSRETIRKVLILLAEMLTKVIEEKQDNAFLPSMDLRLKMKKALVKIVNRFFHLIDRLNVSSLRKAEKYCIWVTVLPYIEHLDEKVQTKEDILANIHVELWKKFATAHGLQLIHYLRHSTVNASRLVKQAVIDTVSDSGMMKLFENPDCQWIEYLPFYPTALAFIKIMSSNSFNESGFSNGSSLLLTRLQILLASRSDNSNSETFTSKQVISLLDSIQSDRRALLTKLLLQMLEALLESQSESEEEIAIYFEVMMNKSYDFLCAESIHSQWRLWVDLYNYSKRFQRKQSVKLLFMKELALCDIDSCIKTYSTWEDGCCNELLDIVANKIVELLRSKIISGNTWFIEQIYKIANHFQQYRKSSNAIIFFSNFISKTFQNKVTKNSIMALCKRSEVDIFSIMVELKLKLPHRILSILDQISDEMNALSEYLDIGNCKVIEFQQLFGLEKNDTMVKNICKLQESMGKLTNRAIVSINLERIEDFQNKVLEFENSSKIILNLVSSIKKDHMAFINSKDIPDIPISPEVMLHQLSYYYIGVLQLSSHAELKTLEWFGRLHCQSRIFPTLWKDAMLQEIKKHISKKKKRFDKDCLSTCQRDFRLDWKSYNRSLSFSKIIIEKWLDSFNKGNIRIKILENLLKNVRDDEIEKEFKVLGIASLIPHAQRLQNILTLEAAILAIRNMLNVLGIPASNFLELIKARFHSKAFKNMKVTELSDKLINDEKLFRNVEPEDVKLLESFGECKKFVRWIQENLKSNQEFKVFLDLASISAGEEPMDIGLLMLFRELVTGFAPLFFDINKQSSMKEVFDALQIVFNNRKRNLNLDKIMEMNQHLAWIEDVKQRHGSVEASSLTTVNHISDSASFVIRCKGIGGIRWKEPFQAITMLVKISKRERLMKHSELDELRSKLMLINVKEGGEIAIDRYTRVLDSIEIIAKKLSKLLDEGCHLFSELKLDGYFDMKNKVILRLDFGHKSGIVNCNMPLIEGLQQIIIFLQKVERSWNEEISELREAYSSLNYFTTEQIVLLSAEFARLVHSRQQATELSLEAAMLMKSVCPTILLDSVKEYIIKAYNHSSNSLIGKAMNTSPISKCTDASKGKNKELIDFRSHPNFESLKAKSEAGEKVIIACLAYFADKENNIEDMANWCIMHDEDDEEDLEEIVKEFIEKSKPVDIRNNGRKDCKSLHNADIQAVKFDGGNYFNNGSNNLTELLDATWCSFLEKNNDELKAKDYIPFRILGLCVEDIISKHMSKPQRTFPGYLARGRPNLLICPKRDIHKVALMIFQADEMKPSPTLPEVLICSKRTTKEQVDLLCRRAFSDDSGKIFVVLHAHLLSLEICKHTENLFTRQSSSEYKIVFLSSAEDSRKSYINTAFEDSLVSAPSPPLDSVLQIFLKYYQERKSGELVKGPHPDPDGFSVRIVTSEEYGNGKSLFVKEVSKKAGKTIRLQLDEEEVDVSDIIDCWSKGWSWNQWSNGYTLFHLDATMTSEMQRNDLLFSLAVLGGLADKSRKVWTLSHSELVMVEFTSAKAKTGGHFPFYKLPPSINCKNPHDVVRFLETFVVEDERTSKLLLNIIKSNNDWFYLMNEEVYMSDTIQRPYQYLDLSPHPEMLDGFVFDGPKPLGYVLDCLKTLLASCPIKIPSWAELIHFSSFLNVQLQSAEQSVFCDARVIGDILLGLKSFAVRFLIQMAKDFATRSVKVSDESHGEGFMVPIIEERRQWEHTPHPYIFFNKDKSLSFLGLFIDCNCNLVDERTNKVIEKEIISKGLYQELKGHGVVFNKQFKSFTRQEKLAHLCTVICVPPIDPDEQYELTYDNVMKILAIIMRFRSNIPVVVMGETGSGKTALIRFMCALHRGESDVQNMIVMKIHGGVTKESIFRKVNQAIEIAKLNVSKGVLQTVLFFDEANTTHAINTIKEVMCDRLVDGNAIPNDIGLQFVAAVNPYRKLSNDMIHKLEEAGLGYHIHSDKTTDKLGSIPMRRLVYRVREIPQSMFPLIWDFGTLDACTEQLYINQMVKKRLQKFSDCEDANENILDVIEATLCFSQEYMRQQKDECFFVSLRDVDRTLKVLCWFQRRHADILDMLQFTTPDRTKISQIPSMVLNLALSIGVTYYVRLQDRVSFANEIGNCFHQNKFPLVDAKLFSDLIEKCQDFFLEELQLENNIAPNEALKENVWMMTVCIELQIPLFLVGKPGSSKSLAKTVVSDVMQGDQSYSKLYRKLKEIHMVSFQCSPIATSNGIHSTFKQCQEFQKKRDLSKFTAVVVLDEIGLAEDSEKMPLKALHPLLEDGCIDEDQRDNDYIDEKVDDDACIDYKKVSCIAISNWALDPAKMNRGIHVSRGIPDENDLEATAEGICKNDSKATRMMGQIIKMLTKGYFSLYKKQEREYFGLRDFYSLVKSVANVAKQGNTPTENDIIEAVQRNFGGFFCDFDPVDYFLKEIGITLHEKQRLQSSKLIFEALIGNRTSESRYILLLTKNNAALHILQEKENLFDNRKTHVMFGSSFLQDKEYTSICYNINKVKIAMELGHTIILCNLNNLYESLYDALNQNYVSLGGKRYVDLGLGTHRVKCRVHEEFRLIIVAEEEEVHKKFPIPLINRLEKHHLSMETILDPEMQRLVKSLEEWVYRFCHLKFQISRENHVNFQPGDVFIGYHGDIIPAFILRLREEGVESQEELAHNVKRFLLSCATPDGITRLSESTLSPEKQAEVSQIYHMEQHHSSLGSLLEHCSKEKRLIQVTTSSRLLTSIGRIELEQIIQLPTGSIALISLQQFESQLAFEKCLKGFLTDGLQLLIIQSDVSSNESIKLIECARFVAQEIIVKSRHNATARIVFIISVQRVPGGVFSGISVYPWLSFHIDELREQRQHGINIRDFSQEVSIASAIQKNIISLEELIIDTVPKATSYVQSDPSRVQRRINVLLEVLKSKDSQLLEIVANFVTSYMRLSKLNNLKAWLLGIAMDSTHMKEGNTYQRSVWLHLQEEIVTPLSMCIETLDMDQGLDLLLDNDWALVKLYMQLFGCSNCTISTGISWFRASFPFSRVILGELEELYKMASASNEQLYSAFQHSRFSEPLLRYFEKCEVAAPKLVIDIVQLTFKTDNISEQARNLLCEEIHFIARRMYQTRLQQTDGEGENQVEMQWRILSPVDIFFAIEKLKPRLIILHQLVAFDDRLCDAADQISRERREEEFRTDILFFQKLLELNAAKPDELCSLEGIELWCRKISQLVFLFSALLNLDTKDKLLPELQTSFNQLLIIKQFLDHTCKSDFRPSGAILRRLALLLNNKSLKENKCFEAFVKFLVFTNKQSIKSHFASADHDGCVICDEGFDNKADEIVELPCTKKHIGCKGCLMSHFQMKEGEWTCPSKGCGEEIPKTFQFESTLKCQNYVVGHQKYKNQLQSFFLEVLQLYVFADQAPHPDVTEQVMSFVVTTKLEKPKTKTISPFANHGIDAVPVIRSFLLQLLLQGNNFDSASRSLERFLNHKDKLELDHIQFHELCLLSVYCLEDRLLQDQTLSSYGRKTILNIDCCIKLLSKQEENRLIDRKKDFEVLLDIASLRLCIISLAPILHNLVTTKNKKNERQHNMLMKMASRVICNFKRFNEYWRNNMKSFLVRVLISLFSPGFIHEWQQSAIHLELMPNILHKAAFTNVTDDFFICSDNYGIVKQHLCAALMGDYARLKEMINSHTNVKTEWKLALYFLYHIENIKVAAVEVFIREVNKINQEFGKTARRVFHSDHYSLLECKPRNQMQTRIISLLYYFGVGLSSLSHTNYIQDALRDICSQTFFPTMKQDDDFEVISQRGHILGTVDLFEKAEAQRDLSSAEVAVTQFFVHAAMAGQLSNEDSLLKCIHPKPRGSLPSFLMNHLENNFEQICQALGKSNNDVMLLLFNLTKRICEFCPSLSHPQASLESERSRKIWEHEFASHLIRPEFQRLEFNIKSMSARMARGRTAGDKALETILSPAKEYLHGNSDRSILHTYHFWFTRTQLNVSSLEQRVTDLRTKCPNLFRILADRRLLNEMTNVPLLFQLQFKLCKLFNKKIESPVVDDVSVERFLVESSLLQSDCELLSDLIKVYFTTFNKLKKNIFANGRIGKVVKDYLKDEELNMNSAAGVLFASEHPAGQCFNALIDCLIGKHNLIMDSYFSQIEDKQYLPQPLPCSGDLSTSQLVSYNENDLNLMLVMHSDYTLEVEGERETKWKLNADALEQNVITRFFAGRSKFRMDSLPRFQFRNDDVGLVPLHKKIHQETINFKVKGQIRKELLELRDVGNILDCLKTTLVILQRTADSRPEDYLATKMEQLHLFPEHGGSGLRGVKLTQSEACFEFLTLLRVRWLLKHKHNPFNLIDLKYHKALPFRSINDNLKPLVDHPQLDKILFQLHLFIHTRLKKKFASADLEKNARLDPPEGMLTIYFDAFLDSIGDEGDYKNAALFDQKLRNCHAVSLFIELLERHM